MNVKFVNCLVASCLIQNLRDNQTGPWDWPSTCFSGLDSNYTFPILLFVAAFLKHPRTPPGAPGLDYQMAESEHLMKRMRAGQSDEVWITGSSSAYLENTFACLGYFFWFVILVRYHFCAFIFDKNIFRRCPFLVLHILPIYTLPMTFQKLLFGFLTKAPM